MAITTIKTIQLRDGADFFWRDGSVTATADWNMGGFRIQNIALDPAVASEAASKWYVDQIGQGLTPNDSVKLYAASNITLSGNQTIDGIGTTVGDRVLVNGQTDLVENGVYVVATGAWTRAADFNASTANFRDYFLVTEGIQWGGTGWFCKTEGNPIDIGTDDVEFGQFSQAQSYVDGDGLDLNGNAFSVNPVLNGAISVSGAGVDLVDLSVAASNKTKVTIDKYGRVTSSGDATTTDIGEGTNLYFTNQRVIDVIKGAISPWVTDDFDNADRVAISDSTRKLATSDITLTELNQLDGISTSLTIQGQLDKKVEATDFIVREQLPSDGTTEVFTLLNAAVANKEHVYLNGVLQHEGGGNDYIIGGLNNNEITFAFAPSNDDTVLVSYIKA